MTDYTALIKMLEDCNTKFDLDEDDFRLALHDLSIRGDLEGMRELTETYAEFNFRVYGNHFKNYAHALEIAQRDLDSFSEDADRMLNLKKSEQEAGYIQKFFRNSMNYFNN